jgi:hypothetical protein
VIPVIPVAEQSVTTPPDGTTEGLRERMEAAMRRDDFAIHTMADAAWAEVSPVLDRLRTENARLTEELGQRLVGGDR